MTRALPALLALSLVAMACPGAQRRTTRFDHRRGAGAPTPTSTSTSTGTEPGTPPAPPLIVRREERVVELEVKGAPVRLNATATWPTLDDEVIEGPVFLLVPGAGDVSRRGLRRGDGVNAYASPVAVTSTWQDLLGASGASSLAWDKRTCGPNDDAECAKNPQDDLDAQGPVALAADVDAACVVARTLPGFDGRLVLMAHGQGAQVALASTCAKEAAAVVLINPIPREIDAVLVDALLARHTTKQAEAKAAKTPEDKTRLTDEAVALRNLAATRQAGFASMRSGKFSREARVDGATIAFWLGWMELTGKTRDLMAPVKDKTVVVIGNGDAQLGDGDRALARGLPAKKTLVVDADHHLLVAGDLQPAVGLEVIDAVVALLQPSAS
jgi:hypothetical protein